MIKVYSGTFKLFERYINNIFNESIDFNSLPEVCPYGFWVSSNKLLIVSYQSHGQVAREYIGLEEWDKNEMQTYDQMYTKGFVRVVRSGTTLLHIQYGGRKTRSIEGAIRAGKDIAMFYGLSSVVSKDSDSELLSEAMDLPDTPPYGFWIRYNDVIVVRGGPGAHWNVGKAFLLNKGINTSFVHEEMFKLGYVRCVFDVIDDMMHIQYIPGVTPQTSIQKAKDVADFYNTTVYINVTG